MSQPSFQARTARKFPPNYREEIITDIMNLIARGESCYLVGISGIGKSNLFRCLWHPETHAQYLSEDQTVAVIWADTNGLAGELSATSLYELILYSLLKWADDNRVGGASIQLLHNLHEKVVLSENRTLSQRHLETALRHLFNQVENLRIVILFDEFEPIVRGLDYQFFKNLRWLRDEFKYHLSYVMAAHRSPIAIREGFFDQGEPLYELLASNLLGIKPHTSTDAKFVISELSKRYEVQLTEQQVEMVVHISGGHAGLIGAMFKVWLKRGLPRSEQAQIEQLLGFDSVAGECRKIWNSLETQDQDTLVKIKQADMMPQSPQVLSNLIAKGVIVKDDDNKILLFSPIFDGFLDELTEQS